MKTDTPSTAPGAQLVGNAFVEQYYHILHHSPEEVYRFYQESSVVSRPESDGGMKSVTTTQDINDMILSMDYNKYKAEIKTADAQESYEKGVIVLVTGCLTGIDNLKRKFTQSFFLAPQDNGFFVLNDVFRYIEESSNFETHLATNDENHESSANDVSPDPEASHVPDPPLLDPATPLIEDRNGGERPYESLDNDRQLVTEKEIIVETQTHPDEKNVFAVVELASPAIEEDAPKQTYASIVRVMKGSSVPVKVYVPTSISKPVVTNNEMQINEPLDSAQVPEASAPGGNDGSPESSLAGEEVEGHSIYVRNLPLNMTVDQLEEEFKKFGPIKPDGVQVRSIKQQGYCFGFVKFLSLSSMKSAIQASPILIGARQAVVEEKRTTTQVGSGRGRVPSGRGGYRSDSFRARSNYGGGRGFGRNEYGNRGEFSGRGRARGGDAYRQGGGRGGARQTGPTHDADTS